MLDFLRISTRYTKSSGLEIYPKFIARRCEDLMIRGSDFYAIWNEEKNLWSTEEDDAIDLIDKELDKFQKEHPEYSGGNVMYLWDAENGFIDRWHKYVQKQMSDNYKPLDEKLIFANDPVCKTDYASKRLPYSLDPGPHEAWDTLIDTLYAPEERIKIEWSIGAIVSGDSKNIQKFLVFYGAQGTGKSTIISIIEKLFQGYYSVFDAKALGLANAAFPLESLKSNPLVAIQHDGDLSHIEDNTRLNSIVSHELMTVNEKFKATYPLRFNSFLIMGTNRPVRITDAKSGMLRRLIDVSPTGNKIPRSKYDKLIDKAKTFELGAIAAHCLEVYENNKKMFNDYVPTNMFGASNDFYNFVIDQYEHFKENDGTTLAEAWPRYNTYCQNAKVPYPLSQRAFKEELKNYFKDFKERVYEGGTRSWNKYYGFKVDKFDVTSAENNPDDISSESETEEKGEDLDETGWLVFSEQPSLFDTQFADYPAQYTKEDESPLVAWANVTTTLKDLDTSRLHYVDIPEWLVVMDFDLKGEDGNKSFEKNLEAANMWPKTYAELSKSGAGIHLHYIYKGDPKELSRIYSENIEVKVFTGGSTLRRKLTKCNNIPIAEIAEGVLPKKEGKKMLSDVRIRSEKGLRKLIERHLQKEITGYTATSINLIYEVLQDAYESGLKYDVSDMRPAVLAFANGSSNQADKCLKKVLEMKFASDDIPDNVDTSTDDGKIVFFDVEVFPNLFVVCWKFFGDKVTTRWINPTAEMIDDLVNHKPDPYRLVGFNNRKYDNHILYAALMGYSIAEIYNMSQRLISNSPNATIGEAYNLSYTDIYDFSSEKKSLKKFEIEYGIHHQELGLPWDKPVPEELWNTVADYCVNDVMATEVVWVKRQGDFLAREILADITGMTVNDTTNRLTTKLIFGDDKTPQGQFVYTHLAGEKNCPVEKISEITSPITGKKYSVNPDYTQRDLSTGQMMFPGYEYSLQPIGGSTNKFKMASTYRGIEVGEGGLVIANHGMYGRTVTKDVTSMHPHSIIALNLFGDHYTKIFEELVHARVAIKKGTKTGDFSAVADLFGGKLMKYLDDVEKAKMLVTALKIAINSVYGLTAAKFVNAFRDQRNDDNIVAKRGALFMVNLKHEVEEHGGKVVHIKTDSIKVENLTEDLEDLICAYGALYGYSFETEHIFDRLCLVNDAVYIGKLAEDDPERSNPKSKYIEKNWWEATGEQFAVPYVFKSLFSHQSIEFEDLFETMSVTSALYLDMNEGLPDSTSLEKELDKLRKKENPDMARIATLEEEIAKCHNYIFVGKAGAFCPIKPGCGGGILVRENHGKYASAGGAKGYRWMEAEVVKKLGKENDIDRSYYNDLVNKAVDTISSFGDFEAFTRE